MSGGGGPTPTNGQRGNCRDIGLELEFTSLFLFYFFSIFYAYTRGNNISPVYLLPTRIFVVVPTFIHDASDMCPIRFHTTGPHRDRSRTSTIKRCTRSRVIRLRLRKLVCMTSPNIAALYARFFLFFIFPNRILCSLIFIRFIHTCLRSSDRTADGYCRYGLASARRRTGTTHAFRPPHGSAYDDLGRLPLPPPQGYRFRPLGNP